MVLLKSVNFVCFLVFLKLFCLDFSMAYSELTIENDHVCSHATRKRRLKLHRDEHSGIILRETRYFDVWSGQYEFECTFIVKGDPGDGVIAVIQQLSFREDFRDSEEVGDRCLDFVQFKRDDGTKSKKYCGKIQRHPALELEGSDAGFDSSRKESSELLEVSENAFYDPGGALEVKIYVKNRRLHPPEKIDLVIVFTSYVACHRSMRNYSSCGTDVCIWHGFFGDGFVNCPYTSQEDESKRLKSPEVNKRGLSSKVTVGAIATIFLSFLLFFVCLWVVRRKGLLCWSRDCSGRRPPEPRVEMHPQHSPVHSLGTDDDGATPLPSAPLEMPTEKDPPPSYDSLFPNK